MTDEMMQKLLEKLKTLGVSVVADLVEVKVEDLTPVPDACSSTEVNTSMEFTNSCPWRCNPHGVSSAHSNVSESDC